jgi:hypothetical protein
MALIGSIIQTIKEVKDYYSLPKQIEELQNELNKPIKSYFLPEDRYNAQSDFELMILYDKLLCDNEKEKNAAVENYKNNMEVALMENKEVLESQAATRYDIEKVALALNEIALVLDKNIEEFNNNVMTEISNFKNKSNEQIRQNKAEIATFLSDAKDNMEKIANEIMKTVNSGRSELENFKINQKEEFYNELQEVRSNTGNMINDSIEKINNLVESGNQKINGLNYLMKDEINSIFLKYKKKNNLSIAVLFIAIFAIGLLYIFK